MAIALPTSEVPVAGGAPRVLLLSMEPVVPTRAELAWNESEQSIVVLFTIGVVAESRYDPEDALWLGNWSAVRLDGARMPALLRVEPVSGHADQVRLRFAGPTAPLGRIVRLTAASAIRDVAGSGIVESSVDAIGISQAAAISARSYEPLRDLRNPVSGRGAGTIPVQDSGDYEGSMSVETLRKVILRTLATVAGTWAHVPEWGVAPDLKSAGTMHRLQRIARDGQQALLAIHGVQEAKVTAYLSPKGLLVISARVRHGRLGVVSVTAGGTDGWEVSGG